MASSSTFEIVVMDRPTASTLSQILLLLTLMVELRRTALHRAYSLRFPSSSREIRRLPMYLISRRG